MPTLRIYPDVEIIKYFKAIFKSMLPEVKANYLKINGKINILRRGRNCKKKLNGNFRTEI